MFRKELLNYIESNPGIMRDSSIGIMPPLESELNQSINDMIKDDREIGAFRVEGYYEDIDFP